MTYFIKKLLHVLIIVSILLIFAVQNAYALKIIPPRLVIKPDEKVQYMFVKNNSNKTEAYRFGWKHLAMDKQGNVINLDKVGMDKVPDYRSAAEIIRFSPRRTVLAPGETQRIAFVTRRSPEYDAGEYRSHFLIEREKKSDIAQQDTQSQEDMPLPENDDKNSSLVKHSAVAIDVLISRSVPIYVLHGETQANLEVINASVSANLNKKRNGQPSHIVDFHLQKTGNRSVIGLADVFCLKDGKNTQLNKISKIFSVYSEADFKQEKLLFDIPSSGCDSINLQITGHNNDVLAGEILVTKSIGN